MRMIIFIEYFLIYKIDKSHIIIDSKVRISFSMKINFFLKKKGTKKHRIKSHAPLKVFWKNNFEQTVFHIYFTNLFSLELSPSIFFSP